MRMNLEISFWWIELRRVNILLMDIWASFRQAGSEYFIFFRANIRFQS